MSDQPDLNPKPVPGPADLRSSPDAPTPPLVPDGQPSTAVPQPAATPVPQITFDPTKPWPGAFEVFGMAVNAIKRNIQPALLYAGVTALLALAGLMFSFDTPLQNGKFKFSSDYEFLAAIAFLLALPTYYLAAANNKVISLNEFMRAVPRRYFFLLLGYILAALIVGFTSLLLLIPLIWTLPWGLMVAYPIVDRDLGPLEGYNEAVRLTKGHLGKVWGIIGVTLLLTIGMAILSFIPVIGSFVSAFVSVVSGIMVAMLYRWLMHNNAPVTAAAPVAPTPPAPPAA